MQSNLCQFSFRPTNSISYESWHLQLKFDTHANSLFRLLRLKLLSQEVPKVAKVKSRKIQSKILKSAISELHKHYTPQLEFKSDRGNYLLWFSMMKIKMKKIWIANFLSLFTSMTKKKDWYQLKEGLDNKLMKFKC